MNCHTEPHTKDFYERAEKVVVQTNAKVREAQQVMEGLREEGLLTPEPFDEPIEFLYFDYWHYFGRTAKHGAFMGGADFVQWHGNYELLYQLVELKEQAEELRRRGRPAVAEAPPGPPVTRGSGETDASGQAGVSGAAAGSGGASGSGDAGASREVGGSTGGR